MLKQTVLIGALLLSSGCTLLAPVLGSVQSAGFTASDRQILLPGEVRKFNDAAYWGRSQLALSMVVPEGREALKTELKRIAKEEKPVETKVEFTDFSEDARSADIDVMVRSYKVPYYVVTERHERQHWVFTLSDGWKLSKREVLKE